MKSRIIELKSRLLFGVSPAMATPLMPDGYRVNTAVVAQLVDFLIGAGAKGLYVGGTTGEGILLEAEERRALHAEAVKAAAGRVPVMLHIGTNRLDTSIALARHAAELGADAIAAVTPYYYGIDDGGLAAYYRAIAQAAPDTPLLLYDIPHMAVNSVGPALLQQLCEEVPSLAGIKTSHRDAQAVARLIEVAPEAFVLLVGNERLALGLLALGAHGLISGLSTAVPEPFVALTRAFEDGDQDAARRQQALISRLLPLLPAGRRIGAIKSILADRGVPVGPAVPPRPMPTAPVWGDMERMLRQAA